MDDNGKWDGKVYVFIHFWWIVCGRINDGLEVLEKNIWGFIRLYVEICLTKDPIHLQGWNYVFGRDIHEIFSKLVKVPLNIYIWNEIHFSWDVRIFLYS